MNKPCYFHAASAVKNEADAIAARYDACDSVFLNISDNPDYLDELVKGSDVVVSLLPYALHAKVARSCIANKVRRKNSKNPLFFLHLFFLRFPPYTLCPFTSNKSLMIICLFVRRVFGSNGGWRGHRSLVRKRRGAGHQAFNVLHVRPNSVGSDELFTFLARHKNFNQYIDRK